MSLIPYQPFRRLEQMTEQNEDQFYRKERFSGRFQRTVTLPSPVSSEGSRASYKHGVLEVRMPKQKRTEQKRIDIEFH